jgi:hypothetical protein
MSRFFFALALAGVMLLQPHVVVDLKFLSVVQQMPVGTSNPETAQNHKVASLPSIPKFA